MQRVVVVGRAGSGKTTAANEVSRRTGIPVVHLDRIFWRAGWQPAPRDEALAELKRAVAPEQWIVDGNFFDDAGPVVFARADTVAFVDAPRLICIWRVLARRVLDWGLDRPDLPAPEAFDWGLIKYIWRWDDVERAKLLGLINDNRHLDVVLAPTSTEALERLFDDE